MDFARKTFEEQENNMNVIHNKNIVSTKNYSSKELGMEELIFNKPRLYIDYQDLQTHLSDIHLSPSEQYLDNQIGEKEYERLIFPVIFVQAILKGEKQDGNLNGIIKPKIIMTLGTNAKKPIKGEMPEFHFYIFDSVKGVFEGRSHHKYDYETTKGISCGIRATSKQYLKPLNNDFLIDSKNFSDICNIYYYK